MADERSFKLRVISPDRIFYEGEAIMLELNTMDGIVGIYKNHMPMTYIIEPGVMRITESEESVKEAALHSGFIQILQEEITVLAEVVEWPDEIDERSADSSRTPTCRKGRGFEYDQSRNGAAPCINTSGSKAKSKIVQSPRICGGFSSLIYCDY